MILRPISNGSISGTGTLTFKSGIVGGVLITTDNSNAAAVVLRRDSGTGTVVIDISTKTTIWITGPFSMEGTETLYYSISGTGASAQLFEWVT